MLIVELIINFLAPERARRLRELETANRRLESRLDSLELRELRALSTRVHTIGENLKDLQVAHARPEEMPSHSVEEDIW